MTLSLQEYVSQDAMGLAALVRQGDVSPAELLECAITLADRLNPRINAINHLMIDEARARLARRDDTRPFNGVPMLLKDLMCAYAGVPMSHGSRAMRHWVPHYNSHVTDRLLQAGFVVFGKTSTPECGLMATTEPEAFGPVRNPWCLEASAGGSSGGSGAAVAARIVPVASAGDGGGSIRIPAAVNRLFGLKPTRGRVSNGPAIGEAWRGAVSQHVLTRTVRDSAAILDVLAGPEPGDPYAAPSCHASFLSAVHPRGRRLRVAVCRSAPFGIAVDAATRHTLSEAVRRLSALGHDIEEAEPAIDLKGLLGDFLTTYFGAVASEVGAWERWLGGIDVSRSLEPATLLFRRIGERYPAMLAESAHQRWHDYGVTMATFLSQYDVFLLPVTAQSSWALGEMLLSPLERNLIRWCDAAHCRWLFREGMVRHRTQRLLDKIPFTQLANLTGQPAMSLPVGTDARGVPTAVQVIGRFGDEHTLLGLAADYESTWPWDQARPELLSDL